MGAGRMTMSGDSPPASFCWMAAGFATVNRIRWPLASANFAARRFATSAGAPELKIRSSAAPAVRATLSDAARIAQSVESAALRMIAAIEGVIRIFDPAYVERKDQSGRSSRSPLSTGRLFARRARHRYRRASFRQAIEACARASYACLAVLRPLPTAAIITREALQWSGASIGIFGSINGWRALLGSH